MASSEKVQEQHSQTVPSFPSDEEVHDTRLERKPWTPFFLLPAVEAAVCFAFLAMAIGLEVMLHYNRIHGGFPVPLRNHNSIVQFLKSFIPTLVFLPLVYCLAKIYAELRALQPYIDLSHGPAPAERTVTLEYVSKGAFETVRTSYKHHHWILTVASVVLLYSGIFTSLAGSLFAIKLHEFNTTSTRTMAAGIVGPNEDAINNRVTYSGAAGYTSASIYNNQTLPAFTFLDQDSPNTDGWMIPSFQPAAGVSTFSEGASLLKVDTQAVQIHVDCVPGETSEATKTSSGFTFTASLNGQCGVTQTTTTNSDSLWFGVLYKVDANCIPLINSSAPPTDAIVNATRPVMVSFASNVNATSAVYCYGYQRVFDVTASSDLNLGRVQSNLTRSQYVSSPSVEGYVFNGVASEDETPGAVQIVGETLANAVILRAGMSDSSSISINKTLQNQILSSSTPELASQVARTFLAYQLVIATSIWVTGSEQTVEGTLTIEKGRILAIKPAVHTLAVLCLLTSFIFLALFILHAKERRDLRLIDRPRPSIAGIGSLLSPNGFHAQPVSTNLDPGRRPPMGTRPSSSLFEVVRPMDTHKEIKQKLKDKRFSLTPGGVVEMDNA